MERSIGALSENPDDAFALRLRAGAFYVFGIRTGLLHMHESALSAYDEVLRRDPEDTKPVPHRGRVQACLGLHDDALESYERALDAAPSAPLCIEYGKFLLALERYPEASSAFGRAAELDPNNPGAHAWKGEALSRDGRSDDALACLERAATLSPKSASAHNRLAVGLLGAGGHGEAGAAFSRAIALDPTDATLMGSLAGKVADGPGGMNALGQVGTEREFFTLGKTAGAIGKLQQTIALEPGNFYAHLGLGIAFLAGKRHSDALEAFEWAASINEGSLEVNFNRCRALALLGRHEEALRALEVAASLSPTDADFHLKHCNALCRLGFSAAATPACRSAIALDPTNPEAHKTVAAVRTSRGFYEGALVSIDRAISLVPNDAISHVHRGHILDAMGRVSDSLGAFYQAMRINPGLWSLGPRP